MASTRIKPWPWAGAVVVGERHVESGREAFHLFDHWCYLGTVEQREALAGIGRERRFDPDMWRLFSRWLAVPGNAERVAPLVP